MARFASALALFASLALAGCPGAHTASDSDAGGDHDADTDAAIDDHDAGPITSDAATPIDAGPRGACDPMDARIDSCADQCFGVTGAFWDGTTCIEAHCDCTGTECEVYPTLLDCQGAHTTCAAEMCTSTGGAWFSQPLYCGNFECGVPPPETCETPIPACDCGAYRVFDFDAGCIDGPLCELMAPRTEEELCGETGGEWRPDICGHATCGRLSGDACIAPGCVCDRREIFDPERGCVRSPSCRTRTVGEECARDETCVTGAICCPGGEVASRCFEIHCDGTETCPPPAP